VHVSFGRNAGVVEHQSMSISLKIVRSAIETVAMSGLLLGTALPASATTLNFDSIATPNCGSVPQDLIPGGYGGFTWDVNLGVECDADYIGGSGNSYGAPSAANVIYNQAGSGTITITRGTDFEFDGATFSGWTIGDFVDLVDQVTAQSVTVTGYLGGSGGTLIGTENLTLAGGDGTAALQYLSLGAIPGAIDTLVISTPLINRTYGNFWLMDDFQYHDAANLVPPPQVPEPTTLILLGSGVVGLLARRRRTVV
jgi:hypothetical protein